ncbi:serine protease [Mesorhizobium sp.]|uniref:trypsin-like serine peptidase n=1 Tax=Mesorhizobium sp. TaxID=1871066 RepID=UPI000FE8D414|nr:serine protease [Mesorhizobium sp.]RWE85118.1 MAG: serine protease [Mesorhizobium sp.]
MEMLATVQAASLSLILSFFTWPTCSMAWEFAAPRGAKIDVAKKFAVEISPDSMVWRSGKIELGQAGQVSIELKADFSALGGGVLRVFDNQKNLVDEVQVSTLEGTNIWTEYFDAPNAYVEIVSSVAISNQNIEVAQVALRGSAGTSDQVVDGSPNFVSPDLGNEEQVMVSKEMKRSVARLIVGQNILPFALKLPSKVPDWCTGFLVSNNLLMTVSHCVKSLTDSCDQIAALFGYGLDATEKLDVRRCVKIVYINRYIDTAVIQLSESQLQPAIVSFGFRPPVKSEALRIIQHPHGSVRLVSADSGCKVTSTVSAARPSQADMDYSLLDGVAFSHSCDTSNGSSGSPVFALDGGSVIGIHQSGDNAVNTAIRIDSVLQCIEIDQQNNSVIVINGDKEVCANGI